MTEPIDADEAFGPPSAEEAFPAPTQREQRARVHATLGGSPMQDFIFGDADLEGSAASHFRPLFNTARETYKAFKEAYGSEPLVPSEEAIQGLSESAAGFLKKHGLVKDYVDGQKEVTDAADSAFLKPAATEKAFESGIRGFVSSPIYQAGVVGVRGFNAAWAAAQRGIYAAGQEYGFPKLAADLAAFPEAFPTGHEFAGVPHAPAERPPSPTQRVLAGLPEHPPLTAAELENAKSLGVLESEEAWKNGTPPAPAEGVKAGTEPGAPPPIGTPLPEITVIAGEAEGAKDIHAAAREIAPEAIKEFDELTKRRDTFRKWMEDRESTPPPNLAQSLKETEVRLKELEPEVTAAYDKAREGGPDEAAASAVPDWVKENRASAVSAADALGLTPQIAAMAREGRTAKEISEALGGKLSVDEVRAVRESQGIEAAGPLMTPGGAVLPAETPPAETMAVVRPIEDRRAPESIHSIPQDIFGDISAAVIDSSVAEDGTTRIPLKPEEIEALRKAGISVSDSGAISEVDREAILGERDRRNAQERANKSAAPAKSIEDQRATIAHDVGRQLVLAGRPPEEAAAAAQLTAARYIARAERMKGALGTPEELYAREGAEIRSAQIRAKVKTPADARALDDFQQRMAVGKDQAQARRNEGSSAVQVITTAQRYAGVTKEEFEAQRAEQLWGEFVSNRQKRQPPSNIQTGYNPTTSRGGADLRAKSTQAWRPGNVVDVGFVKDLLVSEEHPDGSFTLLARPDEAGHSQSYNAKPHEGLSKEGKVEFVPAANKLEFEAAKHEAIEAAPDLKSTMTEDDWEFLASPEFHQIEAYHGSPHHFERFDISKIGTGEGAQAYGHGLYFAENEGVARGYRDTLADHDYSKPDVAAAAYLQKAGGDRDQAAQAMLAHANDPNSVSDPILADSLKKGAELLRTGAAVPELSQPGALYRVSLKPDKEDLLDWDKPLSEQSPKIQKAMAPILKEFGLDEENPDYLAGTHVLNRMAERLAGGASSSPKVTARLREAGIPGIMYADAGSRRRSAIESDLRHARANLAEYERLGKANDMAFEGQLVKRLEDELANYRETHNFVIFDDKDVEITHRNGEALSKEERADAVQELYQRKARPLGEKESIEDVAEDIWQMNKGRMKPSLEQTARMRANLDRVGRSVEEMDQIENHLRELAKQPFISSAMLDRMTEFADDLREEKGTVLLADMQAKFPKADAATLEKIISGKPLLQKALGSFLPDVANYPGLKERPILKLAKSANASTFIHESGHEWLEQLMRDDAHPLAPADLKTDAKTVRDWLGIENHQDLNTGWPGERGTKARAAHEKFATGFEQYLRLGIAPSPQLAAVFAKFKAWLTRLYQTLKGLGEPINEDIRGVFDRMLASEPQRVVAGAEREEAPGFHNLAASLAESTEPAKAADVADKIQSERDFHATQDMINSYDERLANVEPGTGGRAAGTPQPPGHGNEAGPEARSAGNDTQAGGLGAGGGEVATASPGAPPQARGGQGVKSEIPSGPNAKFATPPSDFIDKAGNIRLDKLATPDDVTSVIRMAARDNNDFLQERRGVLSDGATLELADALGMDPVWLDRKKIGEAFNVEEIRAARRLLVQSATDVRDAMIAAKPEDEASMRSLAEIMARHEMIQGKVSGATAEAGRALAAFREVIAGGEEAMDFNAWLKQNTGRTLFQLQQMAKFGKDLTSASQVSKFVHDTANGRVKQAIIYYYVNALISGPVTHARYFAGNALTALWAPLVKTPIAAAVSGTRAILGYEDAQRVYLGEAGAELYALGKGSREGWKAAREGWETGNTPNLPGEGAPELFGTQPMIPPIPGKIGYAIGLPGKAVGAIHGFSSAVRYEQEIAKLAYRQAMQEGLSGDAFTNRVADLGNRPTPEMTEAASKVARSDLYMAPTEYDSLAGKLTRAANHNVLTKIIVPFMKIGTQITRNALIEQSPLGVFDKKVRANLSGANGDAARATQAASIIGGTALMGTMAMMTAEGVATGDGPSDPGKRAVWLLSHHPNSIQIGSVTIPYKGLGSLGMLMSLAANAYETHQGWGDEEGHSVALDYLHGFEKAVLDESFMRGVKDMIDAVYHFEEYGDRYIANMVTNWIPFSVGLGQVARTTDPYQRETRGNSLGEMILKEAEAKVPWLFQNLMPCRDMFGEPIPSSGPVQNYANDRTAKVMDDLHMKVGRLPHKIRGVQLSDQQFDDFSRVAGKTAKMRLDSMMKTTGQHLLQTGQTEDRVKLAELMHKIITQSREEASKTVMMHAYGSDNDIQAKATEAKKVKKGIIPAPTVH